MNVEPCRKALEKIGNPHVLINMVSRRVRQLNSGGGGISRPLVDVDATMGAADVALLEIIEDKIGVEYLDDAGVAIPVAVPAPKRRRRAAAAAAPAAAA
jgi:DNA-directed RNA polymerase subunit K/omega